MNCFYPLNKKSKVKRHIKEKKRTLNFLLLDLQQIIASQLQALKELDDTHEKDNIVLNDRMYQSYDTLSDDIHNHQTRLMTEKEQYEKEKVWITKVRRQQDEKVKLNVGGQLFETSLSTLRKDPNSILAYMFGGKTYIFACHFL
jgi:rubrerythrin